MSNEKLSEILDLNSREKIILIPLAIAVILIGIFPNVFIEPMRLPIESIIINYEFACMIESKFLQFFFSIMLIK